MRWTQTDYLLRSARTRFSGALGAASAANLRLNGRGLPSHVQAIALLIPQQRGYATEQSTSSSQSSESFPPPGFNAEQAKKPIPKEQKDAAVQPAGAKENKEVDAVRSDDKSKLTEVGAAKAALAEDEKKVSEEKKDLKKLTLGQRFKKEAQHYWDGTKLLATEVRISSRLALKMAGGYELSRREHRQVGFAVLLWSFFRRWEILTGFILIASTNSQGLGSPGSLFHVPHCSLCRAATSRCPEVVP